MQISTLFNYLIDWSSDVLTQKISSTCIFAIFKSEHVFFCYKKKIANAFVVLHLALICAIGSDIHRRFSCL